MNAYCTLIVRCYELAAEACAVPAVWERYMRMGDYLQYRRMISLSIPPTVELTHYTPRR